MASCSNVQQVCCAQIELGYEISFKMIPDLQVWADEGFVHSDSIDTTISVIVIVIKSGGFADRFYTGKEESPRPWVSPEHR